MVYPRASSSFLLFLFPLFPTRSTPTRVWATICRQVLQIENPSPPLAPSPTPAPGGASSPTRLLLRHENRPGYRAAFHRARPSSSPARARSFDAIAPNKVTGRRPVIEQPPRAVGAVDPGIVRLSVVARATALLHILAPRHSLSRARARNN